MSATLFVYTRKNLALQDAQAAFASIMGNQNATAILYSPRRCELAAFVNGAMQGSDGQLLDNNRVFEARVFNETSELRWLNDPSPAKCHQAVILTEHEQSLSDDWEMHQEKTLIEKLDQTYLLWGEGTGLPVNNGWSELATARIGGLRVPLGNVGRNQRVLLHSVEYIVEAEHGNAVVYDERLVKLEVDRG